MSSLLDRRIQLLSKKSTSFNWKIVIILHIFSFFQTAQKWDKLWDVPKLKIHKFSRSISVDPPTIRSSSSSYVLIYSCRRYQILYKRTKEASLFLNTFVQNLVLTTTMYQKHRSNTHIQSEFHSIVQRGCSKRVQLVNFQFWDVPQLAPKTSFCKKPLRND